MKTNWKKMKFLEGLEATDGWVHQEVVFIIINMQNDTVRVCHALKKKQLHPNYLFTTPLLQLHTLWPQPSSSLP